MIDGFRGPLISLPFWFVTLWQCFRLRSAVLGLTVFRSWFCATGGCLFFAVVLTGQLFLPDLTPQTNSALQYLAVTLLLSPLIDVLGARRPGHNAWPWFVVLPLIAVLQWPSVTQIVSSRATLPVEIPTPAVVGWLFVLLMGAGNYVGTRNTLAALLGSSGLVCLLLPVTEWIPFPRNSLILSGSCLIAVAATLAARRSHGKPMTLPGVDGRSTNAADVNRMWSDFRDLYGMVWSKRVVDRVNQFAAREFWQSRLSLDGFQNTADDEKFSEVRAANSQPTNRQVQVLCWVLRRFCDDSFFRRYLHELPGGTGESVEA
ncbi:MAG: hypothetical protein R3C19_26265 [Planctomycetaceae bacterium]